MKRIFVLICLTGLFGAQAYAQLSCPSLAADIKNMQRTLDAARPPNRPAEPGLAKQLKDAQLSYAFNCANPVQGVIYPTYEVITLLYAPAGCTGTACKDPGEVDYTSGSSSGTKVSVNKAFANGITAKVDVGLKIPLITDFKAGVSGGFTLTSSDDSSETISKEQNNEMTLQRTLDGVDHNQDVFYLMMNPAVQVTMQGMPRKASWNLGFKGAAAEMAQISVADLKTCSFGPSSPFHKFSVKDCSRILALDPFANGSTVVDSSRFAETVWTFSYLPSSSCVTQTPVLKNDQETDSTHSVTKEYTAGYSLDGSIKIVDLSFSEDFTWTNTSSVENTTGSTHTASFKLPCPANDTGKGWIVVYWDTLYGTFMFMPRSDSEMGIAIQQGHVTNTAGNAAAYQQVTLSYGGKTYYTNTNQNGDYRFFAPKNPRNGPVPVTGQVLVKGVVHAVPLRSPAPVQIRVP